MRLLRTTSALAYFAGALAVGGSALAADATAPAGSGGTSLSEVIVTAQKRATNLQTTPLAISAVSGETLRKNAVETFQDLAHSVPALSYS